MPDTARSSKGVPVSTATSSRQCASTWTKGEVSGLGFSPKPSAEGVGVRKLLHLLRFSFGSWQHEDLLCVVALTHETLKSYSALCVRILRASKACRSAVLVEIGSVSQVQFSMWGVPLPILARGHPLANSQ